MFIVLYRGRKRLVSGFFIHHFRNDQPVRKVLGEVVDGRFDPKSEQVHHVENDTMASYVVTPEQKTPCGQRAKRRQRQKAVQDHVKRVEHGPAAANKNRATTPTFTQCVDNFWRSGGRNSPNGKDELHASDFEQLDDDEADRSSWTPTRDPLAHDCVLLPGARELGITPMIDGIRTDSLNSSTAPSSSRVNDPECMEILGGFQSSEAYLQGFIQGQMQVDGSRWCSRDGFLGVTGRHRDCISMPVWIVIHYSIRRHCTVPCKILEFQLVSLEASGPLQMYIGLLRYENHRNTF